MTIQTQQTTHYSAAGAAIFLGISLEQFMTLVSWHQIQAEKTGTERCYPRAAIIQLANSIDATPYPYAYHKQRKQASW